MSRHELLLYSPAIKVGGIMTQHFEESFPHLHFRIKLKTKKDLKFDVFLDAAIYLTERGEYFLNKENYRTFLLSSLRNLFSYVALNHFKKRDLMEEDDLTYLFTKKENSLQFRIDMIDLSNYKEIAFEDFL